MEALLDDAMGSGAWGMSIGLDYKPGTYADKEELLRLFRIVARYKGVVTAHVQMRAFFPALIAYVRTAIPKVAARKQCGIIRHQTIGLSLSS